MFFAPLLWALPDLERRDTIVMAGPTREGADWVGLLWFITQAHSVKHGWTFHRQGIKLP